MKMTHLTACICLFSLGIFPSAAADVSTAASVVQTIESGEYPEDLDALDELYMDFDNKITSGDIPIAVQHRIYPVLANEENVSEIILFDILSQHLRKNCQVSGDVTCNADLDIHPQRLRRVAAISG